MSFKIAYHLVLRSPVYIGSGLGGAGIKRMLLKNNDNTISISGSTIKGRVRYYCRNFASEPLNTFFSAADIDNLFGTTGDARKGSSICAFSDLQAEQHSEENFTISLRNGVQISRKLGIAKPHALYNTEIAKCHSHFNGKIICHPPEEGDKYLAMLLTGLRLMDRLGGSKTTGLGKCSISLDAIKVQKNGEQLSQKQIKELLTKYLEENK